MVIIEIFGFSGITNVVLLETIKKNIQEKFHAYRLDAISKAKIIFVPDLLPPSPKDKLQIAIKIQTIGHESIGWDSFLANNIQKDITEVFFKENIKGLEEVSELFFSILWNDVIATDGYVLRSN